VGAAARIEWILAVAAAITRLGALSQLVLAIMAHPPGPGYRVVVAIGIFGGLETGWYVTVCLRTRRVPGWATVIDWITLLALLGLPAVSALVPQTAVGESPYFNVVTPASITLGLADWPVAAAVGSATSLGVVNIAMSIMPAHTTYPPWNAAVDALSILSAVTVACVVAVLARRSARATDRERDDATGRARDLAREQERLRQAHALRHQLLATVDALAAPGAVRDDRVAEQIRVEAQWLRGLIERNSTDPAVNSAEGGLSAALHMVLAEKAATGLDVRLQVPDAELGIDPAGRDALVDAVREALTNVAKHSGTMTADVCVSANDGTVVVLIVDRGCGYDPSVVKQRVGQSGSLRRRMADVGGRAEIHSVPGQGTTVQLVLHRPETGGDQR
jgi:signal transduction histidine kinase